MSKISTLGKPGLQAVPPELQATGRELWLTTLNEWDLAESDLALLRVACQQADRIAECQEIIATDGILVTDPSGRQRAHPLLSIEKEAANTLMRAWRMLDLNDAEPPKIGRPPIGH